MDSLLVHETVERFASELAAGSAAPGGGSAAALAGALAAALAGMVARLTAGRERFAHVNAAMQGAVAEADTLRGQLLDLVDRDTRAFEAVMAAFKLPRTNETDNAARQAAIQNAYRQAVETPLQTLEAAVQVLALCETVTASGNPNAITDGGVAALLAEAAAQGAALNVRVNLGSLHDDAFVAAGQERLYTLLAEAAARRKQALQNVTAHLD